MNEVKKMFLFSWKFYAGVFGLVFVLVLLDSIALFDGKGIGFVEADVSVNIEKMVTSFVEQGTDGVTISPMDMSVSISDKATMYDLFNFITIMIGIVALMVGQQLSFTEPRAREFQTFLPVKKVTQNLYHYSMLVLLIGFTSVVQYVVLLLAQTKYNRLLMQSLQAHGFDALEADYIIAPNQNLLLHILVFSLFVIVATTGLYLGMTVAKNPIVGIWIATFVGSGLSCVGDSLTYDENPFDISSFFHSYNINDMNSQIGSYGISGSEIVSSLICIWLVGVLLLVIASKYKELTKGKVFSFLIAEIAFAVFVGTYAATEIFYNIWWNAQDALVLGTIIAMIAFVCIHPIAKKKKVQWEVK